MKYTEVSADYLLKWVTSFLDNFCKVVRKKFCTNIEGSSYLNGFFLIFLHLYSYYYIITRDSNTQAGCAPRV